MRDSSALRESATTASKLACAAWSTSIVRERHARSETSAPTPRMLQAPGWRSHCRRSLAPSCTRSASLSPGEILFLSAKTGSAAADERHLGRHDGHELNVGIERQVRHIEDCAADVL